MTNASVLVTYLNDQQRYYPIPDTGYRVDPVNRTLVIGRCAEAIRVPLDNVACWELHICEEKPAEDVKPATCQATLWIRDDNRKIIIRGLCSLPDNGHKWHSQFESDGTLYAEWSGDSGPIPVE